MENETNLAGPFMIAIGSILLIISIMSFCSLTSGYNGNDNPLPSSTTTVPFLLFFGGIILLAIGIFVTSAHVAKRREQGFSKALSTMSLEEKERLEKVMQRISIKDRKLTDKYMSPPRDKDY